MAFCGEALSSDLEIAWHSFHSCGMAELSEPDDCHLLIFMWPSATRPHYALPHLSD